MRSTPRIGRAGGLRPGPLRWLGLLACLVTLGACGGDGDADGGTGPGPTLGSVRVTASTTGVDLDPDGYTITLDGGVGQALGINAAATFADVAPGDHEVELEGVAANCAVQGDNPRIIAVTAGGSAEAAFEVACTAVPPAAASLAFTAPPEETELHQPLAAVEVTILDEAGDPISTATDEVTLALGANPGNGTLSGATTVSAVEGVARFDDLVLDRRGSGYTLVAVAEGLEGAESGPFDVTFAFEEVTAGGTHSCGLTPSGVAYCWGANDDGRLGDGNAGISSDFPVAVATDLRFRQLSAGAFQTCGVTPDEEAYCWGGNGSGQLGDGRQGTDSSTPRLVGNGIRLGQVTAGSGLSGHTCGRTPSGVAWCWGDNSSGQLGNGNAGTASDLPVRVDTDLSFAAVAAGGRHTCAIVATDVYCWGSNDSGQLGDSTVVLSALPVLVRGGHTFVEMGAGSSHSCSLTLSNEAFCWGDNTSGQLGDNNGGLGNLSSVPVKVAGDILFTVPSLFVGFGHTCAFDFLNGRTVCWGFNAFGQLGDGSNTSRDNPVPVEGGFGFRHSDSDAGGGHTCGVTTTGEAFCWGRNNRGQLGDGNADTDRATPVRVLDPP